MNEEERAERFARDLDQFLFGGISEPPTDLDDHDLSSLFDVARRRAGKSEAARQQAERYEADAWEKLLSSLNAAGEPDTGTPAIDSDAVDSMDMRDVISLRRQLAEDALSLAEQHREDVWNRIKERVADDNGNRQPILVMSDAQATHSQPSFTANDPEFDSLVRIALGSAHTPARDPEVTGRLWARVGGLPGTHDLEKAVTDGWVGTSVPVSLTVKALGFAAAAALLVAAIGPLPATGFAEHPLVETIGQFAEATGIAEEGQAPVQPPLNWIPGDGHEATEQQAASMLGLPVSRPSYTPEGLILVSASIYQTALTAPSGGLYSLAYGAPDDSASLIIFQEADSGPDLASMSAISVETVVDGFPATYFEGGWRTYNGTITWRDREAQTLVFEPHGLRVMIHYSGSPIDPQELLSVAGSMNFI